MLTLEQRENRALFNLKRATEPLKRRQLWCASVPNKVIETLANAGAIATQPCGGFLLTREGSLELESRFTDCRYSTITAD